MLYLSLITLVKYPLYPGQYFLFIWFKELRYFLTFLSFAAGISKKIDWLFRYILLQSAKLIDS